LLELPGKKSLRLEVYCEKKSEAEKLRREYGGEVRKVPGNAWWLKQERHFFMQVSRRFCLASSPEAVPERFQKLPRIIVPAGMAFGTGEHATTAMCLRQLAAVAPSEKGWSMLDVGTGSGVLALAGALLGAKVFAFDFDPDSILESKRNSERNPHIPKIRWKCASVEKEPLKGPYDLVTANLFAGLLEQSMPKLAGALKKGGVLVLSGILQAQEADILKSLKKNGLRLEKRLRKGKWVCLISKLK